MNREARIREIERHIGDRRLVWFGIRGDDAAAYLSIRQFSVSFSINAPLAAAKLLVSESLETLTQRRVDLDAYDVDFDRREIVSTFRAMVLAELSLPSVVVTYRPSHFLSALTFATRASSDYLGVFKDRQTAFEHKPWVETNLARLGLRTIPWEYIPTERRSDIHRRLEAGPVILRPTRTSGGVGIELASNQDDVESCWKDDANHLMGVAPYLAEALPINVSGCVFDETTVTLHPMSIQLIGVPSLTHRRFGYCGNDFAAVRSLDSDHVLEIEGASRAVGRWLGSMGYIGAFGVDFLIHDGAVYFAEVNPRMQGSTRMSSQLAQETGHVDLLLDHLAAFLGLGPCETLTLADWMAEIPDSAQAIQHNTRSRPVTYAETALPESIPDARRLTLAPEHSVAVEPGAAIVRLELRRSLTSTGYDLLPAQGASNSQ